MRAHTDTHIHTQWEFARAHTHTHTHRRRHRIQACTSLWPACAWYNYPYISNWELPYKFLSHQLKCPRTKFSDHFFLPDKNFEPGQNSYIFSIFPKKFSYPENARKWNFLPYSESYLFSVLHTPMFATTKLKSEMKIFHYFLAYIFMYLTTQLSNGIKFTEISCYMTCTH